MALLPPWCRPLPKGPRSPRGLGPCPGPAPAAPGRDCRAGGSWSPRVRPRRGRSGRPPRVAGGCAALLVPTSEGAGIRRPDSGLLKARRRAPPPGCAKPRVLASPASLRRRDRTPSPLPVPIAQEQVPARPPCASWKGRPLPDDPPRPARPTHCHSRPRARRRCGRRGEPGGGSRCPRCSTASAGSDAQQVVAGAALDGSLLELRGHRQARQRPRHQALSGAQLGFRVPLGEGGRNPAPLGQPRAPARPAAPPGAAPPRPPGPPPSPPSGRASAGGSVRPGSRRASSSVGGGLAGAHCLGRAGSGARPGRGKREASDGAPDAGSYLGCMERQAAVAGRTAQAGTLPGGARLPARWARSRRAAIYMANPPPPRPFSRGEAVRDRLGARGAVPRRLVAGRLPIGSWGREGGRGPAPPRPPGGSPAPAWESRPWRPPLPSFRPSLASCTLSLSVWSPWVPLSAAALTQHPQLRRHSRRFAFQGFPEPVLGWDPGDPPGNEGQ